jgi:hypothetical protein
LSITKLKKEDIYIICSIVKYVCDLKIQNIRTKMCAQLSHVETIPNIQRAEKPYPKSKIVI